MSDIPKIYVYFTYVCLLGIGRKQKVILNGVASSWRDVISGVPQGTTLGPVMFLFYVNDIPNHAKSTSQMTANYIRISGHVMTVHFSKTT